MNTLNSAVHSDAALSTSGGGVYIKKDFGLRSVPGRFISGHSDGGGARSLL